nr:hypothetical protein [Tanacetum cinerariifolium]
PKSVKKKVPAKKTTRKQTSGVVIRDTHVESSSKRKEKVDVARGKGIELLSEVALTKDAQYKEVFKKCLRDFQKTHPSGLPKLLQKSNILSRMKKLRNDQDDKNNDNKSKSDGSDEENDNNDDNTQSDNENGSNSGQETDEDELGFESNHQENEEEEDKINVDDNAKGDKDEEMDYTTSQLYDDLDIRLNEPVHNDEGLVQKEDEHLDTRLGATRDEFMSYLSASITARITELVTESLEHAIITNESSQPQSSYEAAASLTEFELKKIFIDKIDKNKDKDEDTSTGSDRGLKKRKTSKDAEPTKGPKTKELQSGSSKDKQLKTFDELMSTHVNFSAFIMNGLKINNLTQEIMLGPTFKLLKGTHTNYAELEYDFEACYKALSEKLDWENPEGGDYSFDLTKPLPLVKIRNHQKNRLTNLPGDDVSDFAIALRMFTKSTVIQKRVEDIQLGVKSYQKKTNVTKPTTRPGIKKKDPYTPYQDPQGFIYVDTLGRNKLMRSD